MPTPPLTNSTLPVPTPKSADTPNPKKARNLDTASTIKIGKVIFSFICSAGQNYHPHPLPFGRQENPSFKVALNKFFQFKKNVYFCKSKNGEKRMSTQAMTKIIADYFKTQPVLKAWLFGSFARGEETPLSDVDLLVQYDGGGISLLKHASMLNELESILDRHVDIVEDGTLRPRINEHVNQEKKLIYERVR